MQQDFTYTDQPNPHVQRGRDLIKKYPAIREWMKPYPLTALYTFLICTTQILIAYALFLYESPWWLTIITAYLIGAIANHALFVLMHEAAHDLIFKSKWANRLVGIMSNIPQGLPSAMSFRTYHLIHHAHMHVYEDDADVPFRWEAKIFSANPLMKALWFLVFLLIESIRPMKQRKGKFLDGWIVFNIVFILFTNWLIFYTMGITGLGYILLSSIFSVGLHPAGARWIQEHYTYKEGQETYSYYGILNKFSFNVGYHNEHHDLFKVPWVHLPKLKAKAPEFYDNLYFHTSWTKVLISFIFSKKYNLYSRILRKT